MKAPGREAITGLVLCGGRGSRMGGADKALLAWQGGTLVAHALERLRPQVAALAVSANRPSAHYDELGVPVWADDSSGHPGPLAGWLTALRRIHTDWLLSVPCDAPGFPLDLAQRLASAWQPGTAAPLAVVRTAEGLQPVFALLHRSLVPALEQALLLGERAVGRFAQAQQALTVDFDDTAAFADADTPEELSRLRAAGA